MGGGRPRRFQHRGARTTRARWTYPCIKDMPECAHVQGLQELNNQMLKLKSPKRTTAADLSQALAFLRRCMCRYG